MLWLRPLQNTLYNVCIPYVFFSLRQRLYRVSFDRVKWSKLGDSVSVWEQAGWRSGACSPRLGLLVCTGKERPWNFSNFLYQNTRNLYFQLVYNDSILMLHPCIVNRSKSLIFVYLWVFDEKVALSLTVVSGTWEEDGLVKAKPAGLSLLFTFSTEKILL